MLLLCLLPSVYAAAAATACLERTRSMSMALGLSLINFWNSFPLRPQLLKYLMELNDFLMSFLVRISEAALHGAKCQELYCISNEALSLKTPDFLEFWTTEKLRNLLADWILITLLARAMRLRMSGIISLENLFLGPNHDYQYAFVPIYVHRQEFKRLLEGSDTEAAYLSKAHSIII